MRQIYIAADGGGTKLELGAVSSQGKLINTVRVNGGINKKTSDEKTVENNIVSAFEKLKEQTGGFEALGCAGFFMYNTEVFSRAAGCEAISLDEGTLGLYAAGIYGDGALILSGTGADVFVSKGGKIAGIIGGYGAILGDEGSGFAIGRAGINAAIASYEGRSEKTALTEYLTKKYPAETFRKSVYGIYEAPQTSREVADFCKECEQAADEGDAVALNIFKEAAHALTGFAIAAYKNYGIEKTAPYTFSGGVITHDIKRGKPLMLPHIRKELAEAGITNCVLPKGTPLTGAVKWIKRNLIKTH